VIVVSDASPINILIRVACVDLLPRLFGRVVIPTAVGNKLMAPRTPAVIREWMQTMPAWLDVRSPMQTLSIPSLGSGESEAIALAKQLAADLLLVDDLDARRVAVRAGLAITGTVGVLERAAAFDWIDLPAVIERLRATDFSVADNILIEALRRDRERRRGPM
jgi:predicted nucleic acid-binding protein